MSSIPSSHVPVIMDDGTMSPDWYRFLAQFHASFLKGELPNLSLNGFPRLPPFTVAELPSAAQEGVGTQVFVTDATVTTYASIVAGGGSNGVPVCGDGVNWRIA